MVSDHFEWDDAKAERNLAKHAITFDTATLVFQDSFAFEIFAPGGEASEIRFVIIGMVNALLIAVVYTERNERIRIISARRATTHEQKEYYRSQTEE